MKLMYEEILALQDVVGNASLALKHLHTLIVDDIEDGVIEEVRRLGLSIVSTTEAVLRSHKPLTFRRNHDPS